MAESQYIKKSREDVLEYQEVKNDSTQMAYKKKDWSTKPATPCVEAPKNTQL